MQLGAMNHPRVPAVEEIIWIANAGFDFVDLTFEPPASLPSEIDLALIRSALRETGLDAVGHTAWYLPIASPFDAIRDGALSAIVRCLDHFAELGIGKVNIHPQTRLPMHDEETTLQRNVEALAYLAERANERGVQLMLENLPGLFNRPAELRRIFDAVPGLGFHLDVGHANLQTPVNLTAELIAACGDRLAHVHLSDNLGGDGDLHLPIGAGTIDWPWAIQCLWRAGYDGTITLEVFSADRDYLLVSRDKVRRMWADLQQDTVAGAALMGAATRLPV